MTLTSGQLEKERLRQRNQIDIEDFSVCYYCDSTGLNETDKFCPNCGFPQRGTQIEMRKFFWNISNKKKLVEEQKLNVKKARNILFILAGLNFIFGIYLGVIAEKNIAVLITFILCSMIYTALGLWSRKQPFPAILSGFFVYIVFIAISTITDPVSLFQGIIWKVIIISAFYYGYKGVKDSKKLEAELESIKKAKDLNNEE